MSFDHCSTPSNLALIPLPDDSKPILRRVSSKHEPSVKTMRRDVSSANAAPSQLSWAARASSTEMSGRAWRWRDQKFQCWRNRSHKSKLSSRVIERCNKWLPRILFVRGKRWLPANIQPFQLNPWTISCSVRIRTHALEISPSFITSLNQPYGSSTHRRGWQESRQAHLHLFQFSRCSRNHIWNTTFNQLLYVTKLCVYPTRTGEAIDAERAATKNGGRHERIRTKPGWKTN